MFTKIQENKTKIDKLLEHSLICDMLINNIPNENTKTSYNFIS